MKLGSCFFLDFETDLILDFTFIGTKLETGVKDTIKDSHGLNMQRMARAVARLVFENRTYLQQVAHFFEGREKVNAELRKEVCQRCTLYTT